MVRLHALGGLSQALVKVLRSSPLPAGWALPLQPLPVSTVSAPSQDGGPPGWESSGHSSDTQPYLRALMRTRLEQSLGIGQRMRPAPMGEGPVREQSWMTSAPLPPGSPTAPAPGGLRAR